MGFEIKKKESEETEDVEFICIDERQTQLRNC